jgi:DNA-binding transcriptional regulator LsrR (DeoR family)
MAKFMQGHTRAAKLKASDVLRIRELYWQEHYTQAALARMFHVTDGTIGRIVRGTSWQQYGGPGTHPGAQEETDQQLEHEAVAAAQAIINPPDANSPEIQASLARVGILVGEKKA